MGKTDNAEIAQETEESMVDIWQIDHSKYGEETTETKDVGAVEEVTEDALEKDTDVTDVTEEEEKEAAEAAKEKSKESEEETEEKEEEEEEKEESEESEEKEEKEETSEEEEEQETEGLASILEELAKEDVLSFDEEKEYALSKDGFKELINETKEAAANEAVEKFKDNLSEEGKALLEAIGQGLSVDEFVMMQQQVDFSKVDVADENNQRYLIEDWLKVQGHTPEEVQDLVKDYEASGMLEKQATLAQRKLSEWQTKQNETLVQKAEADKKAHEENLKKEEEAFKKEVLETREIAGFKIDKKQAEKLYDYITKPANKEGHTQFQLDDNTDSRLLYAYMSMTGFDKTKLSKEIASKQAKKLKLGLANASKDKEAAPKRSDKPVTKENQSTPQITWAFGGPTED